MPGNWSSPCNWGVQSLTPLKLTWNPKHHPFEKEHEHDLPSTSILGVPSFQVPHFPGCIYPINSHFSLRILHPQLSIPQLGHMRMIQGKIDFSLPKMPVDVTNPKKASKCTKREEVRLNPQTWLLGVPFTPPAGRYLEDFWMTREKAQEMLFQFLPQLNPPAKGLTFSELQLKPQLIARACSGIMD